MKIEKNGVITNGTNVLTMAELGMDEPGGVIRLTLADLMLKYGVDLDTLKAAPEPLVRGQYFPIFIFIFGPVYDSWKYKSKGL